MAPKVRSKLVLSMYTHKKLEHLSLCYTLIPQTESLTILLLPVLGTAFDG